jgi:hypothetical protein
MDFGNENAGQCYPVKMRGKAAQRKRGAALDPSDLHLPLATQDDPPGLHRCSLALVAATALKILSSCLWGDQSNENEGLRLILRICTYPSLRRTTLRVCMDAR